MVEADTDRAFIDGIARAHMGVDRYPFDEPGQARVVVTLVVEAVSSPDIPLADDPPHMSG